MFNLEIFFSLLASRFSLPTGQTDQEPACPEPSSSLTPASPEEKAQGEPRRCWAIGDGGVVVGWQEEVAV